MPKDGGQRKTAAPVVEALSAVMESGRVTYDAAILMPGSRNVSCSQLGNTVVDQIETP